MDRHHLRRIEELYPRNTRTLRRVVIRVPNLEYTGDLLRDAQALFMSDDNQPRVSTGPFDRRRRQLLEQWN